MEMCVCVWVLWFYNIIFALFIANYFVLCMMTNSTSHLTKRKTNVSIEYWIFLETMQLYCIRTAPTALYSLTNANWIFLASHYWMKLKRFKNFQDNKFGSLPHSYEIKILFRNCFWMILKIFNETFWLAVSKRTVIL